METNENKSDQELLDLDDELWGIPISFYRAILGIVIVVVLFLAMFAW